MFSNFQKKLEKTENWCKTLENRKQKTEKKNPNFNAIQTSISSYKTHLLSLELTRCAILRNINS